MEKEKGTCKKCHGKYLKRKRWQRFCSVLCRNEFWNEFRTEAYRVASEAAKEIS